MFSPRLRRSTLCLSCADWLQALGAAIALVSVCVAISQTGAVAKAHIEALFYVGMGFLTIAAVVRVRVWRGETSFSTAVNSTKK